MAPTSDNTGATSAVASSLGTDFGHCTTKRSSCSTAPSFDLSSILQSAEPRLFTVVRLKVR